jgi:hypothetical protein
MDDTKPYGSERRTAHASGRVGDGRWFFGRTDVLAGRPASVNASRTTKTRKSGKFRPRFERRFGHDVLFHLRSGRIARSLGLALGASLGFQLLTLALRLLSLSLRERYLWSAQAIS